MGTAEGFHGYGPEQGYDFLRNKIVEKDYAARGIDVKADEIFVSDGAKSDCGNIGDIFSVDNKVAVCDPVYPVYVDTNAMAGRAGDFTDGKWNNLVYMPCKEENGFMPQLPEEKVDIIYLCFPNNPIGVAATREQLKEQTGLENLRIFGKYFGFEINDRSDSYCTQLGLTEHLGKRVSTYSKGMKRKLSLLIVIMMGRDILLMDEPTSGVDPISRVEIRSLIEALKADGKTVIITSHDLSEIEKCADDVSMIKNGRLLFDKGIQEMQGQSLEEIFIKEGNRHE